MPLTKKFRATILNRASSDAAFRRQNYKDATNHFSKLLNDRLAPAAIQAQAFFALGDTYVTAAQNAVQLAEDPLSSVVLGAGKMLSDFDLLRRISME